MKKLAMLLIAGVLACGLMVGCGDSGASSDAQQSGDAATSQDTQTTKGDVYTYDLNGTKVALHAEMAPIVEDLGEADSYFESESCAFQGLDKVYTYGSVVITTYPVDNVDYVYSIELKDDTVETAEGICIGASKDDVTAAYGDPAEDTGTALVYEKGESTLSFILEDDAVSSIVYTAVTE